MKTLMTTIAAVAISATTAFAANPSDVDHMINNVWAENQWEDAFFHEYATTYGGHAFISQTSTIGQLEQIIDSTKNELDNEFASLKIYLADEALAGEVEASMIQVHALNGKVKGLKRLITAIEGTTEVVTVTQTVVETVEVEVQVESAHYEADISVLNDEIAALNAEVDALEAAASDVNFEAYEAGRADGAHVIVESVASVIEGYNSRDADKFRANPTQFTGALYDFILSVIK